MQKILKFRGAIGLVMLGLACSALAQSPASQPPPSEPYVWRNVVMGGGGFVTGIIPHPRQKGLMYARTDVGGAYRWDDPAQRWIPITDWMGMADWTLTGIESIAVDPNDPQRVYLAAGIYNWGNAAILRSDDQGKTFQRTDVPSKWAATSPAVSTANGWPWIRIRANILFFGSRRDGLWKSADRGATWQKVESFPNIITTNQTPPAAASTTTNSRPRFPQQAVGIVSVVFDPASGKPGSPTPVLYAAVSATGTNLFCSTDGGVTWLAVSNQPVGLRPNHLVRAPDGMFYLSYGREPGPNSMSDGAIWKFNPKDGVWTDITPVHPKDTDQPFGYGCVAVDAQHPQTLMATTFTHWHPHDEIFRSTNGGASWTQLWETNTTVWDYSSAPYTATRSPHWMGTIVINPFNSDQVLFTTGYGIWCCTNATAADAGKPTHWVFLDQGLEETVPLTLISPPKGAHLLSGWATLTASGTMIWTNHPLKELSPASVMATRKTWRLPEKTKFHRPHRHRRRPRNQPHHPRLHFKGRRQDLENPRQRTDQQLRRRPHYDWNRISSQLKVDKVYIEVQRNRDPGRRRFAGAVKKFFLDRGVRWPAAWRCRTAASAASSARFATPIPRTASSSKARRNWPRGILTRSSRTISFSSPPRTIRTSRPRATKAGRSSGWT
jgi:hypothetical protein